LFTSQEVTKEEGVLLAREFKTTFFETSAMQNIKVRDDMLIVMLKLQHL
jgi:hypothetical protein